MNLSAQKISILVAIVFAQSLSAFAQSPTAIKRNSPDYRAVVALPGMTQSQLEQINKIYDSCVARLNMGMPLQPLRKEFYTKIRSILTSDQLRLLQPAAHLPAGPIQGDPGLYNVTSNIPYVKPPDAVRVGDLYLPKNEAKILRPAVLYIHGGGWSGGDKLQSSDMPKALAAHGFVVFNINYRLVHAGGEFPANFLDVKDAMAFLASKSDEWKIDKTKIAVMGGSAGAHLAMLLGYCNNPKFKAQHYPQSIARPMAVVSYYGPCDFVKGRSSMVDEMLAKDAVAGYVDAAPITYANTAVPTLFVHGTRDDVVSIRHSQKMHQALLDHRIRAELLILEGAGHGFAAGDWLKAKDASIKFLDSVFNFKAD